MVKKALHITPGIEPLYGTRDENLRLMEDGLNVQIDLRSDSIQLEGDPADVARVEGIFADFEHLRSIGHSLEDVIAMRDPLQRTRKLYAIMTR